MAKKAVKSSQVNNSSQEEVTNTKKKNVPRKLKQNGTYKQKSDDLTISSVSL